MVTPSSGILIVPLELRTTRTDMSDSRVTRYE
jgi:hypothetical protein